jgi:serine/threonine-protein kinase
MATPEDLAFAQTALALQLVNERQIEESRRIQEQLAQKNKYLPLRVILLKQQYLSASEVTTIVQQQKASNISQKVTAQAPDLPVEQAANVFADFVDTITPGRRLGKYEIIKQIGEGGMGKVYQGRDPKLQRIVALKTLLRQDNSTPELLVRFQREAQLLAEVLHPNIVQIFEIAEEQGTLFFAMEYVEGETLRAKIKKHLPTPREAVVTMVAITHAIAYLHSKNIIHRDLKPSNIMMQSDGTIKVMDFGLAKKLLSEQQLTRPGDNIGTIGYMPPEQYEGQPDNIDVRSDVYSLGVMLYEMLTGTMPFQGETPINVYLQQIKYLPKSPLWHNKGLSLDVANICLKAIEKEKPDRYQSVREMAADLTRYLNGEPVLARPLAWHVRTARKIIRRPVLLSAAVVLLLAFVVNISAYRLQQDRPAAQNQPAHTQDAAHTPNDHHQSLPQGDDAKELSSLLDDIASQLPSQKPAELAATRARLNNLLKHPQAADYTVQTQVLLALCTYYHGDYSQAEPKLTLLLAQARENMARELQCQVVQSLLHMAFVRKDFNRASEIFVQLRTRRWPKTQFAPVARTLYEMARELVAQKDYKRAHGWLAAIQDDLPGEAPYFQTVCQFYLTRQLSGDWGRLQWLWKSDKLDTLADRKPVYLFQAYCFCKNREDSNARQALDKAGGKDFPRAQYPECEELWQDAEFAQWVGK